MIADVEDGVHEKDGPWMIQQNNGYFFIYLSKVRVVSSSHFEKGYICA